MNVGHYVSYVIRQLTVKTLINAEKNTARRRVEDAHGLAGRDIALFCSSEGVLHPQIHECRRLELGPRQSALGVGVGLELHASLDDLHLVVLELACWLGEFQAQLGIHRLPAAFVPAGEASAKKG